MVWVLVDHDVVAVPQPVAGIAELVGEKGEVVPPEPEPTRSASLEPEDGAGAEAACEAAVLPRMSDLKTSITAAGVMSDPAVVVRVDVRGVGMRGLIAKTPL